MLHPERLVEVAGGVFDFLEISKKNGRPDNSGRPLNL